MFVIVDREFFHTVFFILILSYLIDFLMISKVFSLKNKAQFLNILILDKASSNFSVF